MRTGRGGEGGEGMTRENPPNDYGGEARREMEENRMAGIESVSHHKGDRI